jgi:hypothetical protein
MLLEWNPTQDQLRLLVVVLLILMGYHRDAIWSVMG